MSPPLWGDEQGGLITVPSVVNSVYTARRWARIARSLPGRTDNEIKNYWRSHLRKEALHLQQGLLLSHYSLNLVII